ncbi:hypothetical protein E4U19_007735 [Claviceps sp. Clav32 group G5]|nr:hypothetical protein E4U19_007735 [Claviceps sp. Clav32 group G5]
MINLEYEGDTAKYLTDLLQLNDVVGYCGLPFRTHVARKLPKQIIRLVYSAGGNVPEDDDEFVKAIATAGRLYEKMLANAGTGYTAKAKAYKQKNFTQDKHHRNQHSQHPFGIDQSLINQRKANAAACLRCGRDNHKALMCYAKKDLDGRQLPPAPTKNPPSTVAALKRPAEEDTTDEEDLELEQQPPQKVAKISGLSEELPIFVESSDSDSDF